MTWIAWTAVVACLACILAKWVYAYHTSKLEQLISIEQVGYRKARRAMVSATQKQKILIHEKKQLEAKLQTTQRDIGRLRKAEKDLTIKESEAAAVQARQRELLDLNRKG